MKSEQDGDAVVFEHDSREPLGFLGGDGKGPARFDVCQEQVPDSGVKPALGDPGGQVVVPVDPDGVFELARRHPGDVQ